MFSLFSFVSMKYRKKYYQKQGSLKMAAKTILTEAIKTPAVGIDLISTVGFRRHLKSSAYSPDSDCRNRPNQYGGI